MGGRWAILHLARLGCRRIAFVGGTDPEARQRLRGYQKALAKAGLAVDPRLIRPIEFELETARATVTDLQSSREEIDGIVASSDLMALGAVQALQRAGLSVPK